MCSMSRNTGAAGNIISLFHNIPWTQKTGGVIYATQEEDEQYGNHTSSYSTYNFKEK